jgi:hypothetical protein
MIHTIHVNVIHIIHVSREKFPQENFHKKISCEVLVPGFAVHLANPVYRVGADPG